MSDTHDVDVDFMDMTDDHRLWVRAADVRPGLRLTIGARVVVGDEDALPRAARVIAIDADGNVELEVLPGSPVSDRASPTTTGG